MHHTTNEGGSNPATVAGLPLVAGLGSIPAHERAGSSRPTESTGSRKNNRTLSGGSMSSSPSGGRGRRVRRARKLRWSRPAWRPRRAARPRPLSPEWSNPVASVSRCERQPRDQEGASDGYPPAGGRQSPPPRSAHAKAGQSSAGPSFGARTSMYLGDPGRDLLGPHALEHGCNSGRAVGRGHHVHGLVGVAGQLVSGGRLELAVVGVLGRRAPEPVEAHQRQRGAAPAVLVFFVLVLVAVVVFLGLPVASSGRLRAVPFVDLGIVGLAGGQTGGRGSSWTPREPTSLKTASPPTPESPTGASSVSANASATRVPPPPLADGVVGWGAASASSAPAFSSCLSAGELACPQPSGATTANAIAATNMIRITKPTPRVAMARTWYTPRRKACRTRGRG